MAINLNDRLVDLISDLAPWLTPIPSAVLVSAATVRHLAWPEPVGWISGAIVEMLGISTVSTTMLYYSFNQDKRQSDPELPWMLPAVLAGVYLAATVVLTVLLDTIPLLARWSPVIFPILALVGAVNLILRRNYHVLIRKIAEERERMRALRLAAKEAREMQEFIQPQKPEPVTFEGLREAITAGNTGYACPLCSETFGSQNALNAHKRIHRNGRPLAEPTQADISELERVI